MSETQSRKVGAYVSANPPLQYLYMVGGFATPIGALIAIIASFNLSSYDGVSSTATVFLVLGATVMTFGVLALIGGAVAHAVNWQILNR